MAPTNATISPVRTQKERESFSSPREHLTGDAPCAAVTGHSKMHLSALIAKGSLGAFLPRSLASRAALVLAPPRSPEISLWARKTETRSSALPHLAACLRARVMIMSGVTISAASVST